MGTNDLTKRRFLTLLAGGLGLTAGCSERGSTSDSTESTAGTATPTETAPSAATAPPTETDTTARTDDTVTCTTFLGSNGLREVDPDDVETDAVAYESLTDEQQAAFEQMREDHKPSLPSDFPEVVERNGTYYRVVRLTIDRFSCP